MLRLGLLGPVTLSRDGVALPLPIKKMQALLVLLAHRGTLTRAQLVDLLWPGLDETTGRRNLRRELARLRESGAAEVLHAEGDQLSLAATIECDVRRFEAALADGRPDEALALWRGAPAVGLQLEDAAAFDEWWAAERERLLALRRRALAASAAAHEARGELDGAIERVQQMLVDDPLQEQLHREAMRLLARAGRREAALAQYARCEQLLAAELGLAPMAATRELVLTLRGAAGALADDRPGEMATPMPAAAAAPLPAQLPFVGRTSEVAALELAWRAGRAIVIVGEGGVGKSRLATEFAAAQGPYALVRARAADAAVPYASVTRALRSLAGPAPDPAALSGVPDWVRRELSRLLPEWGASPPPLAGAAEQARFVEACAIGWLALGADSFDAVILDDWHHADAASAELLAYLAQRRFERGLPGPREVLLLRPELADDAHARVERLARGADALQIRLAPFPGEVVFDLVRQLSGVAEPRRFAARLARATGGNAFFLSETLRHLSESAMLAVDAGGAWRTPFDDRTDDYRELPVPVSVLEAVRERVQRLAEAPRRLLEVAALAGEPFTPGLLAGAAALSELDALLAIEQAVAALLLREHESGGYAFAHDLVQQAIEGGLGQTRRRLVHRRLALAAMAAGAPAAVVASHHEAGGEPARAVAFRIAAGDVAERLHALAQAVAHWEQGLADGPDDEQRVRLHQRLMRTLDDRHLEESSTVHARALQALVPSLAEPLRGEVLLAVAQHLATHQQAPEALALLDGLRDATDLATRVALLRVRAGALRELGRVDEALGLLRGALEVKPLADAERMPLLDVLMVAEHTAGDVRAAAGHADEYLALARRQGDAVAEARALMRRGSFRVELGEYAAAETDLDASAATFERVGHVGTMRGALFSLCCLYSALTRPADVLAAARRGWDAQPPLPASELRLMYRLAFVDAHLALGELGAAWEHAQGALADALAVGEPMALLTCCMTCHELLALLGAEDAIAPLLAQLPPDALRQMPQAGTEAWVVRAQSALMLGQVDAASALLDELSGTHPDPRVQVRTAIARAQLAAARGAFTAALAGLPPADAPGLNAEMQLRSLALRVEAEARQGGVSAATRTAARAALDARGAPPHALAALLLRRALADAGLATAADSAAVETLAASLASHPEPQASFTRRWLRA